MLFSIGNSKLFTLDFSDNQIVIAEYEDNTILQEVNEEYKERGQLIDSYN